MSKNTVFALIVIGVNLAGSHFYNVFPNWNLFSGHFPKESDIEILFWEKGATKPQLLSERSFALNQLDRKILSLAKQNSSSLFLKQLLKTRCELCSRIEIATIQIPSEQYLLLSPGQKPNHLSITRTIDDLR